MNLLLVRHTRPLIASGRCYGRLDVPLAATGASDVEAAIGRLKPVARIYASPARRCQALAAALGARDGVPVTTTAALEELDFGAWEGEAWERIERAAIDAWAADPWGYAPGGGETLATLWARVAAFAADLPRDDGRVAVVSHHGPLRVLLLQLLGRPWQEFFNHQLDFGAAFELELPAGAGARLVTAVAATGTAPH